MKKNILICGIFVILIILVIVFCVIAGQEVQSNKTKVVTSFYPMYIATLNLVDGIDEIELQNLISNSAGCVHDYTLTPQEMMNLSHAKALVINGSGMEGFLNDVISNYSELTVIDTSIGVRAIDEENHGVNPHTFVSIDNYIVQVQNIFNGLVKLFPEYTQKLTANKDKYISELNDLKAYGITQFKNLEDTNIVAINETFEYFAEDFGLNVIAVIEEEEGVAASATDVAKIIKDIKSQNVRVIITESDSATNTADTIARETNTKLIEFNPALTGGNDKDAYINAYRENIDKIANALNGGD